MVFIFAWRYLMGKKSTQAIQIISWVSILAMAAGTAALIIVLSVFNGFEGFIKNLYSSFYPELKISSTIGKTFSPTAAFEKELYQLKGIKAISKTIEEKVLFTNNEQQVVAILKGIDTNYNKVSGINEQVKYGHLDFTSSNEIPPIVLGIGVSNKLGASEESHLPITCYAFKKQATSLIDMASSYSSSLFEVTGVYVLQDDIDNQYVFAPIDAVAALIQKSNQVSAFELRLDNPNEADKIKSKIELLDSSHQLKVETRYEQNKTLYFILKSERWVVYAILTLMLIIASFNIVGSMSMLVLDKDKDIAILKAMGMKAMDIKKIFLFTGILLSILGAFIGSVIALLVCLLQQHFGFVKLGGSGSFLIEAYPVKLSIFDFILVLITVVIISFFATLMPAIKASKKSIQLSLR